MQPPDPTPEFPAYNEPLPPPGTPYSAARHVPETGGYSGRPPRGPVISFDAIGEAWGILSPNIGIWVAAVLVYNIVVSIPMSIGYAINIGSLIAQIQANPQAQPQFGPTYFISMSVFGLITFVLTMYMYAGLTRMAIDNVRTGRVEFARLFSATDVLPSVLGAAFLMGIAVFGGFLLCVIPGLLLGTLFMFVFPLIVEKKMGVMQALSTSMDAVKPQMWMALAYLIVLSIISQAGVMVCCIGYMVTLPLYMLCLAVTYRDFFPEGAIPDYRPPAAEAPLADPNG